MKNKCLCVSFSLALFVQVAFSQNGTLEMWYDEPADEWRKSLPMGIGGAPVDIDLQKGDLFEVAYD